ncbi:reverse transcriptase domain-containing protein [Tanacetum coccineum]
MRSFNIWGIDIMGPFLESYKFEHILVAVDYVSKWAKAQALPMVCPNGLKLSIQVCIVLTSGIMFPNGLKLKLYPKSYKFEYIVVVISFLKKVFCRFGMPKALISDRVKDNLVAWSRKLDDALWTFRIAYKTPTGTTPYKLLYGKNYHLPYEIEHRAYLALKNCNPGLIAAGEKRMFKLHELDELRHQAYENSRLYKARTKVWHDRKLNMRKEFKKGNKVLLFHSKYKFK